MSSWSSRFNSWASSAASSASGRFSPFSYSNTTHAPTVTEDDFSYITTEELAAGQNRTHPDPYSPILQNSSHNHHHHHHHHDSFSSAAAGADMGANASSTSNSNASARQSSTSKTLKDTDVLTLKHKKTQHTLHFPAQSIDNGTLSLSEAQAAVARKLGVSPPSRVRLLYAGRDLNKLDSRSQCRDAGLHSDALNEILVIIGAAGGNASNESDDDESETSDGLEDGEADSAMQDGSAPAASAEKKRRKRKPRKKKSSAVPTATTNTSSTPTVEHLPTPSGLHPNHHQQQQTPSSHSRNPSPAPPQTAQAKLNALSTLLQSTLLPQANAFIAHTSPSIPSNATKDEAHAKREFEYKRLSETILAQVLLKLDGVETEGDAEARKWRKELVREAQEVLNKLDAAWKGRSG